MKKQNQLLLAILASGLLFSACKKTQEASAVSTTVKSTSRQDDFIPTPAGLLLRSHIHPIENGYAIMHKGGHIYKIERQSKNIIDDYGEVDSPATKSVTGHIFTARTPNANTKMPPIYSVIGGWATFAYWENTGTSLIDSFQTNWTVPNIPGTPNDNQLIYLFNGLTDVNGLDVIQPVLQFGYNGYYPWNSDSGWVIDNWYAYNGIGFYNPNVIEVSPGTNLEGLILYTGGSYTYSSSFINPTTGVAYDNTIYVVDGDEYNGETISTVPKQVYTVETMETYHNTSDGYVNGVANPSDYPAEQNYLEMDDILSWLGGTGSNPTWTADNNYTPNGESTDITPFVNNSTNGGGAVYIYWHPAPTIGGATSVDLTTTSTPYTITAYPGTTVNVLLAAITVKVPNEPLGTTTANLSISTAGVTFNNGSTSVSVTNNSAIYTISMPPSGSIAVTGYSSATGYARTRIAEVEVY